MQATRRCLLLWHRLQEHAGIHDSHAERLLAREKAAWEVRSAGARRDPRGRSGPRRPTARRPRRTAACRRGERAAGRAEPGAMPRPPPTPPSDEPWIETARCPSCNECQNINDKMFAYNENKQAVHQGHRRRHLPPTGRGRRGLPGGDHPSGQAAQSERARTRGTPRARQAVPVRAYADPGARPSRWAKRSSITCSNAVPAPATQLPERSL